MTLRTFAPLFPNARVRPLWCGYLGAFNFWLFNARRGSRIQPVLAACQRMQSLLNIAFRVSLKQRGAQTGLLSPHLLFIGVKQGSPAAVDDLRTRPRPYGRRSA
jgi:hypothetical protein